MMKKSLVYFAVVAVASAVFSMSAMATPVSITNPSFEDHGPYTHTSPKGPWVQNAVDGWQRNGSSGIFEPSTPGNSFGINVFTQNVPDGVNTAFINTGSIWQILTETLAADTTYTLQAEVGWRIDNFFPSHSLQLRTGGITLASASASPLIGQFDTASLTYSTAAGDPIGKNLEIWLVKTGVAQVNWDNVRLNADKVAPVPEPSTVLLLGSGLGGLMAWRKMKSQS